MVELAPFDCLSDGIFYIYHFVVFCLSRFILFVGEVIVDDPLHEFGLLGLIEVDFGVRFSWGFSNVISENR